MQLDEEEPGPSTVRVAQSPPLQGGTTLQPLPLYTIQMYTAFIQDLLFMEDRNMSKWGHQPWTWPWSVGLLPWSRP